MKHDRKQYSPKPPQFDAYDKTANEKRALGDEIIKTIMRAGGIQSADYIPNVSGWVLLPNGGLKLGKTGGVFPPGSIGFSDIADIATARLLGRSTAGTGSIEELTVGTGLTLVAGVLSATGGGGAIAYAPLANGDPTTPALVFSNGDIILVPFTP